MGQYCLWGKKQNLQSLEFLHFSQVKIPTDDKNMNLPKLFQCTSQKEKGQSKRTTEGQRNKS